MDQLKRIRAHAPTRRELERWVRSVLPRREPRSSLPRVLGGLALLLAGAAAALLLSPKKGSEMRALARQRIEGLRRRANDFAESHDLRREHDGRGSPSQGQSHEHRPHRES